MYIIAAVFFNQLTMYKKISVVFFSVLLTVFFFISCTKPDINFGESYLDNGFTNIVYADSATPAISTIFIDSFVTSATSKAVAGTYSDPYFGTVSAQSYFPLSPPVFSDIYGLSVYDSIELILKLNKSYYGDTTKPIQIYVHELDQTIQYAENKTSLYNLNSFTIKQVPLGTKIVSVRPSVNDTVSIRLSDALGIDLLEKFRKGDGNVTSSAAFLNYFKGVRVSASNPAYILGFSDSVIMRLHYHDPGVFVESKNIDFNISDFRLQFNQINIDRSTTLLKNLNASNTELLSSATNNMSFLQSATGSLIKISFPYIHDFFQIRQFVKVVRAQLVIKPVANSFNDFYPLPPQLRLSQTSLDNSFGSDITSISTGTTAAVEYGNLNIDPLYGLNTSYTYDVTNYILAQMAVTGYNENGLLLSPPPANYPSNFNRLVIGDKNNMNGNIQLKLYYLTVDK